jgi:peptidyl serine alpha-galactosyltransferase
MQHSLGMGSNTTTPSADLEDAIIMLLDPDMVLLRPMSHDYSDRPDIEWIVDDQHPEPATKVVRHGFPIAQQDGYLGNNWMKLNLTYIVNGPVRETPILADGPRIWNSGPPYLATVRDMYAIALKWVDFVPRVHHVYPELYAGE